MIPIIHRDKMTDEIIAPKSILEQIFEDMFPKLEQEEDFNSKTLEELKVLASRNSLTNVDEVLNLLREQGDSGENP